MASEMKSGKHTVALDLSDYAAGSYLMCFSAGKEVISRLIVKE
jgi:hypothetical protein